MISDHQSSGNNYFASHGVTRAQGVVCKATNAYFSHILTSNSLTAEGVQEFLPQRLLITYFAASAVSVTSQFMKPTSDPFSATLKENLVADLVSCFDAKSGGFCPMPCVSSTAPASIAMTFCALHVLDTASALDDFLMISVFPPTNSGKGQQQHSQNQQEEKPSISTRIKSFILRCYVPGRGFSSVLHNPHSTSGCQDAEVTPREACSALFSFWLVSNARRDASRNKEGGGSEGLLSSREAYISTTTSFLQEFNEGAAPLGFDADDVTRSLLGAYVPHEGAFGACLGSSLGGGEGHSGLTFCAVVALTLLGFWTRPLSSSSVVSSGSNPPNSTTILRGLARYAYARRDHFGLDYLDDEEEEVSGEEEWLVGFQGRPNKDSDTCYSFWLLSTMGIIERVSTIIVGTTTTTCDNEEQEAPIAKLTTAFVAHGQPVPDTTSNTTSNDFSGTLSEFTFQTAGIKISTDNTECTLQRSQEEMVGLLAKCNHVDHDPVHAFLGLAGVLVHPSGDGDKYALCEAFLKDIWSSPSSPTPNCKN